MTKFIAERVILYTSKDDFDQKRLTIKIGVPYLNEEGIAKCPVKWDGLFEEYSDVYGIDLIHALNLATDIDSLLRKLSDRYNFYWETGEPYFD